MLFRSSFHFEQLLIPESLPLCSLEYQERQLDEIKLVIELWEEFGRSGKARAGGSLEI